jgi:hypothetical protein
MDWLVRGIGRLPVSAWLFYGVLLTVAAIVNNAVFWLDGSLSLGSFNRTRLTDSVYLVLVIALYDHLRRVASRSFQRFRPLLPVDDIEARGIGYRLSTLPRRLGWLALFLGAGLAVVIIADNPQAFGVDVALTSLPRIYQYCYTAVISACLSAVVMQTIRQLRLVTELHRRASGINLFQLAPVHALANLSARAGIGLTLFMLFNAIAEASTFTELNLLLLIGGALLAISVFLIPLLAMRSRLRDEKARLIGEANAGIERTVGRIHDRVNSDRYDDISGLNTALTALVAERGLLQGISTWPWEVSTLGGFVSSLVLPIALLFVARLLARLL